VREFNAADTATFVGLFEAAYRKLYSRSIPGAEIEVLSWAVALSAPAEDRLAAPAPEQPSEPEPRLRRRLFDPASGKFLDAPVYRRSELAPGACVSGPAVIAEDDTSTVISPRFDARIDGFGYIELNRRRVDP
jgi:N-methylhydantoinase A